MANLFRALEYTLEFEGGFSDDPLDRGGATNYGITQRTLNNYLKAFPTSNVPDRVDKMSVKDAEEVYRRFYWKYDGIADQTVATKLFDMGVNFGVVTAVKMLQGILGLYQDGVFGPMSLSAVNGNEPTQILSRLVDACVNRYNAIIERDPSQVRFKNGWMRRAKSVPQD